MIKKIGLALGLALIMCLNSCVEGEQEYGEITGTFRPGTLTQTTTMLNPHTNELSFSWMHIANVARFELQISRDSLSFVQDLETFIIDGSESTFDLNEYLWGAPWQVGGSQRYSARIRSHPTDPSKPISGWNRITWLPAAENIFNTMPAPIPGLDNIEIFWYPGKAVTRLLLVKAGEKVGEWIEVKSVDLTPYDVAAGRKLVTGLPGSTAFTVHIFDGNKRRGTRTASTLTLVSSVEILEKEVVLGINWTKPLTANVLPVSAFDKRVTWSSDKPAVAEVDPVTGVVTGKSEGMATITVTTVEGGHKATTKVGVAENCLVNGNFVVLPNIAPATGWTWVDWDWFVSYYTFPGRQSQHCPSNQTDMGRHTGDFTNPLRALFIRNVLPVDELGNKVAFRMGNSNIQGGIYQLVDVKPGREYILRADIGFDAHTVYHTFPMESVKILHPDGKKLYEAPVPAFEYTIYEEQSAPPPAFLVRGAVVEVMGRFTAPAGGKIRFQVDHRTGVGENNTANNNSQTPRTYVANCELIEVPVF